MRKGTAEMEVRGCRARVSLDLDGSGKVNLQSGSAFLDHMLHAFSRTASLDLEAQAGAGFFRLEALGAALGGALSEALLDRSGIRRYGSAAVPMDEALAEVALDFSGRPYLVFAAEFQGRRIGDLETQDIRPFLEAVCVGARLTLHVRCYGENDHHKAESIFKALGFAVKQAVTREGSGVPSTKGVI
ncbi:MAG: imidazoleglycerol-phosphate dehydratase [Methanotrichaceae archaeon]|nr:imidazoleglycerol-phosphate dehydratase [Methanotrichaceae archaeon]